MLPVFSDSVRPASPAKIALVTGCSLQSVGVLPEKLPTWPNSRLDELLPLANPVTIDNPPPTGASQTRSG